MTDAETSPTDEGDRFIKLALSVLEGADPEGSASALELGLTIVRAGNRLQNDLDTYVNRPAGATWATFRVLFTIQAMGSVTPKRLARLSNTSAASVTSVLKTLDKHGLIVREPDPKDGRSVSLALSPAGEAAASELFRRNHARMEAWAADFSEEERALLVRMLGRILYGPRPPRVDYPRLN